MGGVEQRLTIHGSRLSTLPPARSSTVPGLPRSRFLTRTVMSFGAVSRGPGSSEGVDMVDDLLAGCGLVLLLAILFLLL
jgi:hypothetical protein